MNYNNSVWHLQSLKWLDAVGVFCISYLCCMFLCRENEVLKVQLKKYVGAVQMLKREGSQGNDGKQHTQTHTRTRTWHQYDLKLDFISVSQCSEEHTQENWSSVSFPPQSCANVFLRRQTSFSTVWIPVRKPGNLSLLCLPDFLSLSLSLSAEDGSDIWPRPYAVWRQIL